MVSYVTYWRDSKDFLTIPVTDVAADPDEEITTFEVAIVPYPGIYEEADWQAADTFDEKTGIWIEGLDKGDYRVWARHDAGPGNEVPVIFCGFVGIR